MACYPFAPRSFFHDGRMPRKADRVRVRRAVERALSTETVFFEKFRVATRCENFLLIIGPQRVKMNTNGSIRLSGLTIDFTQAMKANVKRARALVVSYFAFFRNCSRFGPRPRNAFSSLIRRIFKPRLRCELPSCRNSEPRPKPKPKPVGRPVLAVVS